MLSYPIAPQRKHMVYGSPGVRDKPFCPAGYLSLGVKKGGVESVENGVTKGLAASICLNNRSIGPWSVPAQSIAIVVGCVN